MTALIAAETLLLGFLSLLVVGLLRSHAEILRRLERVSNDRPGRDRQADEFDPRIARPRDDELDEAQAASEIVGVTLEGDAYQVAFPQGGPSTLIAFLSSGCEICGEFWDAFSASGQDLLPRSTRLVIVTKDTTHESPSRLDALAPRGFPVIMSTAAWESYDVPMAPYFVHVDGASGRVAGEGAAANWDQLKSLFTDYLFDIDTAERRARERAKGGRERHDDRTTRVDDELQAAGIGPGHPSLYPEPENDGDADLAVIHVAGNGSRSNATA